jgi:hypothetical protein
MRRAFEVGAAPQRPHIPACAGRHWCGLASVNRAAPCRVNHSATLPNGAAGEKASTGTPGGGRSWLAEGGRFCRRGTALAAPPQAWSP